MKKTLIILAVVFGIAFVALSIFYWTTPANMLPAFLPGHDPSLATVHMKHGVAALVVGLALLVYAWFASAKKAS